MSTPILRIVVTDANVLINLMHVSRLGLLAKIPNHEFVVPEHVREEITIAEQRTTLDAAVTAGWLKIEVIDDIGAITVFTELIAHIGRGEAACIAIAAQKGWLSVGLDTAPLLPRGGRARTTSRAISCSSTTGSNASSRSDEEPSSSSPARGRSRRGTSSSPVSR